MDSPEPELMRRLADGDDLALNSLMDRWGERVASFLVKMTGDQATAIDLAQETFVKLYQARDRYRSNGNFSTYLFSIAANLARNHTRWKSRHPNLSFDDSNGDEKAGIEPRDPSPTPEQAAITGERVEAVHQGFLKLSPDLREAMSLFVYEDMSYAEIADICRCSPKAVETRIYRARQMLRQQLGDLEA